MIAYDLNYLRSEIIKMAGSLPGLQVTVYNDLLRAGDNKERLLLICDQLTDALYGNGSPEA